MEHPTDIEVSEYLDKKYPAEAMEGHRQQLYSAAYDIAQRIVNLQEVTNPRDGMIMRRAWECSRAGQSNIACSALGHAMGGFDYAHWEHVAYLPSIPGFLTTKEKWHSARLSGVTVYRDAPMPRLTRGSWDIAGHWIKRWLTFLLRPTGGRSLLRHSERGWLTEHGWTPQSQKSSGLPCGMTRW